MASRYYIIKVREKRLTRHGVRRLDGLSVSVVFRLVGAFDGNADVVGLLLRQNGQLDTKLGEMEPRNLFVQFLVDAIDADREVFRRKFQLRKDLVRERATHDERRMAGGATEIDETAAREKDDAMAVRKDVFVDLRFGRPGRCICRLAV